MITNQQCWFYEQAVEHPDLFPGGFKPHAVWLVPDKTILFFFVRDGRPATAQFDCAANAFAPPRPLDFGLFKCPTFDFSFQRAFLFQNRLVLVKNALQADKNLVTVSNTALSRLYPVSIDLPCDFLHNGVTQADGVLYFFGGVTMDPLRCHGRFFRLDLCVLRLTELTVRDPGVLPSPRCLPYLEVHNDDLFLAGGYPSFPFQEGWRTADDAWFFGLKTQSWKTFNVKSMRLANIQNVSRDDDRVCIVHRPKHFEVFVISLETYNTSHWVAANPAWVPPGVSSEVGPCVPVQAR